jgi:hypothetical protein
LFLANFFGAVMAAIGIYRGRSWGWSLGALVSVGAFVGYMISRTVGLPGFPVEEEWLELLGSLSLLVESLFVGLFLTVFVLPLLGAITTEAAVAPLRQLLAAGSRAQVACLWCPWCRSELWPYSWGSGSLRPGCCAETISR